ncbi:hypothetical protein [Paenibacillus sp. S150]|uniref:hypothetical protein n=1 Tax=Paenibacillus sp. S150 TaxID=2749826 RepID=UPI001C5A57D3|nr:hypothetical protein [Paenibacillus sp. S150]MBW4083556.1 hypothetical protein [Paenibacillus sp. S150]
MEELNEYEFEVHFRDQPYLEIIRRGKTQLEALFNAEHDYENEPGYAAVISVDPHKI